MPQAFAPGQGDLRQSITKVKVVLLVIDFEFESVPTTVMV
jgi:hypothetical protein